MKQKRRSDNPNAFFMNAKTACYSLISFCTFTPSAVLMRTI